ncbi:MAG: putative Ser/Thr protein kinase [Arcticibacterium sp.]|jgi:predicted Ser/Thr protein kinase
MKHETEIDKLLKELLYDKSWMDDEDYKEVIDLTFKTMGITKQKLSDDIETGIKNGYTVKQQIDLLKQVLKIA